MTVMGSKRKRSRSEDDDSDGRDLVAVSSAKRRRVQPPPAADADVDDDDDIENEIGWQAETIRGMFPQCDPDYIDERLWENIDEPDRMTTLATELLENKYPRLKPQDREEQEKRRQLESLVFDAQDFCRRFPHPETEFGDASKPVSDLYKEHARKQLLNDLPRVSSRDISAALKKYNFHYTPAYRQLVENAANRSRSRRLLKNERALVALPNPPLEPFYFERLYAKHESEMQAHLRQKQQRIAAARRTNTPVFDCSCCFDRFLLEDIVSCDSGHLFCSGCVIRAAEVAIGEARPSVGCLETGCREEYSLALMERLLPPSQYALLLRRNQEVQLMLANIEGLVNCPFCSYAAVITDPNNHLFRCQNPLCMRESCRLCGEESHGSQPCAAVEKSIETQMRTFIERRISEAIIRVCWKCKKRFTKTDGCNMMTCTCGARMCYLCRRPLTDYNHFDVFNRSAGSCQLFGNDEERDRRDMETAAEAARKEFLAEHPECRDMKLKSDPVKLIEQNRQNRQANNGLLIRLFNLLF